MDTRDIERNLPPSLLQRINDEQEQIIFTKFLKSSGGAMISNYPVIANPPLPTPTYLAEKTQFVLSLDQSALKQAVIKYQAENGSSGSWEASCSWQHVLDELENARRVYKEKAERNPLRRGLRNATAISRNVLPLIDGLPQENGVGLLQAALKIIFNAVKRRSDTCEKIFRAFDTIPDMIMDAEEYREIFANEEKFLQKLGNLYHQLNKCIPELIDILLRRGSNDSAIKRHCKSIFGDSLAEVDSVLRPINEAKEQLIKCQRTLDSKGIAGISNQLRITSENVHSFQQQVAEIRLQMGSAFTAVQPTLDEMNCKMQLIINRMNLFIQERLRVEDSVLERQKQMDLELRQVKRREMRVTLTVSVPSTVCTEEEQNVPPHDLYLVRRNYHDFSSKALARAQYLLTMDRFVTWLMEPDSKLLLVEGYCGDQNMGRISPMSVLCACLIDTLCAATTDEADMSPIALPHQPRIILFFFCGLHVSRPTSNGLYGPHGMIRSLVDQLLLHWPPGTELPVISGLRQRDPEEFLHLGLEDLCMMFEQMLDQLGPEYPVYCIIEGISNFETSIHGWNQQIAYLLGRFHAIISRHEWDDGVADGEEKVTVKFLLVSTDTSIYLRSWVSPDRQVELQAGNMDTSSWLLSP